MTNKAITLAEGYVLRTVKEQDLPFILDIFNECILDHSTLLYYETVNLDYIQKWYQACRSGGYAAIAIVDETTDRPIAYAYLSPTHPFPAFSLSTMLAIYISSNYRRQGLGRVLVSELLKIATQQKFKNVVVYISSSNTASIKLFESFQFTYVGKMNYWAYNFGNFIDGLAYQYIIPETQVVGQERPTFEPFVWE